MVDILHKAAYRTGLGNSIFVKKDFLGKHDSETVNEFEIKKIRERNKIEWLFCIHSLVFSTAYRERVLGFLLNRLLYLSRPLSTFDFPQLRHFVSTGFTANRATVAGVNVDGGLLQEFAQSLTLESGDPNAGNGAYQGGEIRKDKYGNSAQVAIAAEGAG